MRKLLLSLFIPIICAAVLLFPVASRSQQSDRYFTDMEDKFWALFLAGDIDGIELALDDLEVQVSVGRIAMGTQTRVYDLLGTTHPEIGTLIARWTDKYPLSKHAQTAAMLWHSHRAWLFRGTRIASETHWRAFEAMQTEFEQAEAWGRDVVETHAEFIPAQLGYAALFLHHLDRTEAPDFLARTFAARPNKYVVSSIVDAFLPKWGNDLAMVRRLCQVYAPRVPKLQNYDAKLCLAEAAILGDIEAFGMRIAARRLLDTQPERFRSSVLVQDAFYHRKTEAKKKAALLSKRQADVYLLQFTDYFADPGFQREIVERALRQLDARLQRDPHNNFLISEMVQAIDAEYRLLMAETGPEQQAFLEQFGERINNPETLTDEDREKLWENKKKFDDYVARIGIHAEERVALVETQIGETGVFDPEMWSLTARSASRGVWAEGTLLAERISREEKAYNAAVNKLIFSNYAIRNFDTLESSLFRLLSAVKAPIRDGTDDLSVAGIDLQAMHEEYSCRVVRAQRLARLACKAQGCVQDQAPGANLVERLNWYLIDIAECPGMESASPEDLLYPEPE